MLSRPPIDAVSEIKHSDPLVSCQISLCSGRSLKCDDGFLVTTCDRPIEGSDRCSGKP